MVAPLRRVTFENPEAGPDKSNQSALAPPLGASLSLGMPVIRHCCVGPPPPAIHGLRRLNRHPCRFAPRSNIEFRPAWFNGALKIKSRSKAKRYSGNTPVGANLFARRHHSQRINRLTPRFAAFGSSYRMSANPRKTGRLSGRRAFDFDLRRPVKPRWPNADSEASATRQDAGLAAPGHGWPIAAAHGSGSAGGYAEPRRGTEWWGKSVLLTFALFKSDAL